MELWIRSQDRWELHKAEHIRMRMEGKYFNIECGITVIGTYKTKERALEVLDEIQSKLKGTFLMKMKKDGFQKVVPAAKSFLEELNSVCIVTGDENFDLEPINKDIYVYEMPKE